MASGVYRATCLVGLALTIYTLWVEYQTAVDPDYVPLCHVKLDVFGFEKEANCQVAFTSRYGKGLFGFVDHGKTDFMAGVPAVNEAINKVKPFVAELPNPVPGLFFYVLMYWLGTSRAASVGAAKVAIVNAVVRCDFLGVFVAMNFNRNCFENLATESKNFLSMSDCICLPGLRTSVHPERLLRRLRFYLLCQYYFADQFDQMEAPTFGYQVEEVAVSSNKS